jgi:hypothetical protein
MPDRDGIRAYFPGAWANCVKFASEEPAVMAQALHATVTSTATKSMAAGTGALKPLVDQLLASCRQPFDSSKAINLHLPPDSSKNRACQAVLRAAYETLADNTDSIGEALSLFALTEQLVTNYLTELCEEQFLSILEIKGLGVHFATAAEALSYSEDVKAALRERLKPTVDELVANLDNPQVTPVKMPRKMKRQEEEVLQDKVLLNMNVL